MILSYVERKFYVIKPSIRILIRFLLVGFVLWMCLLLVKRSELFTSMWRTFRLQKAAYKYILNKEYKYLIRVQLIDIPSIRRYAFVQLNCIKNKKTTYFLVYKRY